MKYVVGAARKKEFMDRRRIDKMIFEKSLTEIYFSIRNNPGWLSDCYEAGFSRDELEFMERLDIEFCGYQPEQRANAWADEVMADGGPEILAAETDDEKIKIVSKAIASFYEDIAAMTRGAWSYADVQIQMDRLNRLKRLRNKFRARQVHTQYPDSQKLTEWEIEKARQHPINELIGVNENERIVCPFHNGNSKTFSLKNGWGYCFNCQESCDSIKWLMTQENYSFKEAVKKLQF